MFNENSAIVRSYVFLIQRGLRNLADVPPLYNLYDMVKAIVEPEPVPEPEPEVAEEEPEPEPEVTDEPTPDDVPAEPTTGDPDPVEEPTGV